MSKLNIGIIDYGVGNTLSVANALNFLNYKVIITSEHNKLKKCDVLILPGVGAFDVAMTNLLKANLKEFLNEEVFINNKPILGICVGMQLMASYSLENGRHDGLNWISGAVMPIIAKTGFPIPHVGWNTINLKTSHDAFKRLNNESHFYFDHGYHFVPENKELLLASVEYGESLTAAIVYNHILGVQFHPEKSHLSGLKLFRDFISMIQQYA